MKQTVSKRTAHTEFAKVAEARRPLEPCPGASLDRILDESVAASRREYTRAWHRAERVAHMLTEADERVLRLTESLQVASAERHVSRQSADAASEMHTLSLATKGSSERVFVVAPPYDLSWTSFLPPGAQGTIARGPSADRNSG